MTRDVTDRLNAIYDAAYKNDGWAQALHAVQVTTGSMGMTCYDTIESPSLRYGMQAISPSYDWIRQHLPDYGRLIADPERSSGLDEEGEAFVQRRPPLATVLDEDIWDIEGDFLLRPEVRYSQKVLGFFRRFFVNHLR